MPRINGVMQLPPGSYGAPNTTIKSAPYNTVLDDFVNDANEPRPVSAGGTGGQTPAEAREALGAFGATGGTMTGALTVSSGLSAIVTANRTSSGSNSAFEAKTTAGSVFFGNQNGTTFAAGATANLGTSPFFTASSTTFTATGNFAVSGTANIGGAATFAGDVAVNGFLRSNADYFYCGTGASSLVIGTVSTGNPYIAPRISDDSGWNFSSALRYNKPTGSWSVGNNDIVTAARAVSAGNGLSGGGDLSTNRSIALGTPGSISGSTTNAVTATSHTHALNLAAGDITNALGFTPAWIAINIAAGNGLTGGGNLGQDRTITMGTPGSISNASTNAVTTTSHTHALGFTAAEVYTGATAGATTFPIGHTVYVRNDSSVPARNAAATVYIYASGNAEYSLSSISGGASLGGTWRSRGNSGGHAVHQRTA